MRTPIVKKSHAISNNFYSRRGLPRIRSICLAFKSHDRESASGGYLPQEDELLAMSPSQLADAACATIRKEMVPSTSWMEVFVAATRQERMIGLPMMCYLGILELAVMSRQVCSPNVMIRATINPMSIDLALFSSCAGSVRFVSYS